MYNRNLDFRQSLHQPALWAGMAAWRFMYFRRSSIRMVITKCYHNHISLTWSRCVQYTRVGPLDLSECLQKADFGGSEEEEYSREIMRWKRRGKGLQSDRMGSRWDE